MVLLQPSAERGPCADVASHGNVPLVSDQTAVRVPLLLLAGVAVVTRMLNAATTHYTRTLARPGTALPSRPQPLSGSSAQWDSLTGNICELVSNVASANSDAQRAFTQVRVLRMIGHPPT